MNLEFLKKFKKMDKNTILVSVAIIGIVITGGLIFANSNPGFSIPNIFGVSDNQIGKNAVDYINNNKLASTPASLVAVSEASGLVKVTIKIGTQTFDSYVTKDGKLLFPQAYVMDPKAVKATASNSNQPTPTKVATAVKKSDKPLLEAFVVSSCPFGLQMQRAVVDAVKNIPTLTPNVAIKYIGAVSGGTITSMHGPEEAQENLRQICIREEQPTKFWNYLTCYMKKTTSTAAGGMPLGDSTGCQASTGIDTAKLNSCVSNPAKGLAYAQKDFASANQYGVSGSPTLILNGAEISETGFGGRSSDGVKSMVCSGFNSQPSFCSTKLNTTQASTSFSLTYASASGSTASNNNCNTVQ